MNVKNAQIYCTDTRRFVHGGLRIEDGRIACFEECTDALDMHGAKLIPGMVDIHTHGRAGYDFTEASKEQLREMARSYAAVGTTTAVPTLASAAFTQWLDAIALCDGQERPQDGGCRYLGVHLEGRYLCMSRRGTHAPDLLFPPSVKELDMLREACGTRHLRISMAPELPEADAFIRYARECGVQIGIAHTDVTFDGAMAAAAAGADVFTHLFNAMRPFHHRDPGTVGAGLLSDAYVELICDGFHLHPGAVELTCRVKQPERIVLITDSMAGAGCPDGEYAIAGLPVAVRDGKAINAEGTIAGSTLDLLSGLKNYAAFCGISLEEAIPAATRNPARCAGIDRDVGELAIGKYADFLVLDPSDFRHLATFVGGEPIGI